MTELINKSDIIGEFDYKKYCNIILSVLPSEFKGNLNAIHLVDKYDNEIGCDNDGYGCYIATNDNGIIFINIKNLSIYKIPSYLYKKYPEISALFLSEIVGHEFGHHVNAFHVKKICDKEEFANKYAESCYFYYIKKRKLYIYMSYYLASINLFMFNHNDRMMFKKSIEDIMRWIDDNKYIDFPKE